MKKLNFYSDSLFSLKGIVRLLTLIMFIFTGNFAFSQFEPGTAESVGGSTSRGVAANGLTVLYSVTGNYYLSADAAGGKPLASFPIDVNKPSADATVFKAYLFGMPTWNSITAIADNCITLAGTSIVWDGTALNTSGSYNSYKDVTAIVAPIMDPAGVGITSLTVTECSTPSIDGVALLVIFSDASAPEETIVILFGGLSTNGDSFSIALQPIDPNAAGALLNMGLGIEFGYQGNDQYSVIDVNGSRLTTSAGGADDAVDSPTNGNLITLGGLGDSNANPADPYAFPVDHYSDDELYSLLPFITDQTSVITVVTNNPSDDDNIFLSYFEISGAAIIGEGILVDEVEDSLFVGSPATVSAFVQDDQGNPVVGTMVDFTILSGPNAGTKASHSVPTDATGHAFFTYSGTGGPGVDQIQACFTNSLSVYTCSNIASVTWRGGHPPVPLSNWALYLGAFLIAIFIVFRYTRRLA